jgi:HK97 gp10 family phage protein
MTAKFDIEGIMARARQGALIGVMNGAEMVRTEAIRTMTSEAKTGRKYPGLPNRSSAPGESPARQSGRLIAGIDIRPEPAALRAVVNASTAYAAALEFGTQKMAPRPFMRPALAAKKAEIEREISARVAEAIR